MIEHGTVIKANARDAKTLSAILSPTRDFVPTDTRGQYVMEAADEVQALRDADFLAERGVVIVEVIGA